MLWLDHFAKRMWSLAFYFSYDNWYSSHSRSHLAIADYITVSMSAFVYNCLKSHMAIRTIINGCLKHAMNQLTILLTALAYARCQNDFRNKNISLNRIDLLQRELWHYCHAAASIDKKHQLDCAVLGMDKWLSAQKSMGCNTHPCLNFS